MSMKMSLSVHKGVFFAAALCIAALLFAAAAVERRDRARHEELYARYEEANTMYAASQYAEAYDIFSVLSQEYPNSYVIELKTGVCAANSGKIEESAARLARTLELYPLYARDEDFMNSFAIVLDKIGDHEEARRIEDYYRNLAPLIAGESPLP